MKTLNPKLILDYLDSNEDGKTISWDEMMELLGHPNEEWLWFHLRMWRKKGKLDILITNTRKRND